MQLDIKRESTSQGGRFYANLDDINQAEITYVIPNSTTALRICNHTFVPKTYEGQGIALELVKALIDDARENHLQYVPLCPYVAWQSRRHPEWSDVFIVNPS